MYHPHLSKFQEIGPNDGTVDFYLRVGMLAGSDKRLLDFGAGRAEWFEDDNNELRRSLRTMKGRFEEVVATDVDSLVMENRSTDRNLLMKGNRVPLEDESVDVIVADYVLEHIPEVKPFRDEVYRLLKPGGWFCARTPHKYSYFAFLARIIDGPLEDTIVKHAQPNRKEIDIFPKAYNLNTIRKIQSEFTGWNDFSYVRRVDPAYYFGCRPIYHAFDFAHRILPKSFCGNIFIFMQKMQKS